MKDDCREVKAPQERFQSALRCLIEEPEQKSLSALRGLLVGIPELTGQFQLSLARVGKTSTYTETGESEVMRL